MLMMLSLIAMKDQEVVFYSASKYNQSRYNEHVYSDQANIATDSPVDTTANDHSVTLFSSYMRTPLTKSQQEQLPVSTLFKRTRSHSDVGEQAHFVHVCIEEPFRPAFHSCMTRKSMLRVYDYDHPSDDDVPIPRGRTIAHANVCMITNGSDDDDMSTNEPGRFTHKCH